MAPLLRKLLDQNIHYSLIYTAQHQEEIGEILGLYQLPPADKIMFEQGEAKTKASFIYWFFVVFTRIIFKSNNYLPTPGFVLTHGDTFTAWMAALMGKLAKCTVCHIESGLRSFNLLSPFPEEISRLITFKLSDIYFCVNQTAIDNLGNYKGLKVNTAANTLLDGVRHAIKKNEKTFFDFQKSPYVMVSLHRFENIFTSRFTDLIIPLLENIAKKFTLIFTMHPATREQLHKLGLYEKLEKNQKILLQERFSFVDWINVCNQAEFVITDGGSNQEELFYLGVPTMLFRFETERIEGLNTNILLSKFDPELINMFLINYKLFRKEVKLPEISPSQIIINTLSNHDF